jgi:hypothetical protein
MRENSLVQMVDGRGSRPVRTQERPARLSAADGTAPPAVALLVAPALLAVCFR